MWNGCSTNARTEALAFSTALRASFSAPSTRALIAPRLPAICQSIVRSSPTISARFSTPV